MSGWIERRVPSTDVEILVRHPELGDRPVVVFAHGFTDDGRCWGRVAAALSEKWAPVLCDARNHGGSGTAVGGIEAQGADLAAVIVALGLDRPTVVGHSMGAAAAASLSATRPELVGALVLVDPPWTGDGSPSPQEVAERHERLGAYLDHVRTLGRDQLAALGREQHGDWDPVDLEPWVDAKPLLRAEAVGNLDLPPWPAVIEQVKCPTLLLRGHEDRGAMVTGDVAMRMATLQPLLDHRLLPGGHNLQREAFDPFLTALVEFLERR